MARSTEQNRAIIYTRVSSKRQVDTYSLENQERTCLEYAARSGYVVDKVFTERGESAKTTERSELQNMLRYIESNHRRLEAVIIYKVDRWARDTFDYGSLRRDVKHHGMVLLSATENFQDTPDGHLQENNLAAVAQYDNELRALRSKGGMVAAVAAGQYVWRAPMGYLNGGPKSRQSLVLGDAQTVSLVRKSFDLIDSGLKISKALEQVRREGLKSRDGHVLSLNTFRTMLMNKVYIGYIVAFEMTVRGDFDPIVTEDVFYRVQPKLHRKPKNTQVHYLRDNPEFPLRGVEKCPVCGHTLTASESKGNGGKYGYYSCSNCGKSRFRKEVLENWFVQGLRALNLDKQAVNALSAAVDANLEENRKWVRTETTRINNKITSLREEKDAIIQKSINGTLPDDVVKAWFDRTSGEEEGLKGQLALTATSTLDTPDVLKRGLEILEHLDLFWEKSNLGTRQQLQGFVFPQGVTARKSGFGTDPIALCLRSEELPSPVITRVVGPPGFEPRTKWL